MPETMRPINKIEAARARLQEHATQVAESEARIAAEAFPEPIAPGRRGFLKWAMIGGGALLLAGTAGAIYAAWRKSSGAALRAEMGYKGPRRREGLETPAKGAKP